MGYLSIYLCLQFLLSMFYNFQRIDLYTPWYKASIDFSVRNIKEFFSNFCLGHRSNTSSESRGREGRVFPEREGSGRDLKHEWWV